MEFLEGLVDKYTWQGLGSSFGLSDLLAAFLVAQLEAADVVRSRRRNVTMTYRHHLAETAIRWGLELPLEPADATPADHMFYVLLPPQVDRTELIDRMRQCGVHPTFHYVPLHSSPAGVKYSDQPSACPVTDDVSARLLRLPFYNDLSEGDIERVVRSLDEALGRIS
jgi:dTDP-4-amino-4,6-dideoxygalactose transaminase